MNIQLIIKGITTLFDYFYNIFISNTAKQKNYTKWKPKLYTIKEENEYCESDENSLAEQKYILTIEYIKILSNTLNSLVGSENVLLTKLLDSLESIDESFVTIDPLNEDNNESVNKTEIIDNYLNSEINSFDIEYVKQFLLKIDAKMLIYIINNYLKNNKEQLKFLILE